MPAPKQYLDAINLDIYNSNYAVPLNMIESYAAQVKGDQQPTLVKSYVAGVRNLIHVVQNTHLASDNPGEIAREPLNQLIEQFNDLVNAINQDSSIALRDNTRFDDFGATLAARQQRQAHIAAEELGG